MRTSHYLELAILVGFFCSSASPQSVRTISSTEDVVESTPPGGTLVVDQVIDRMIAQEHAEISAFETFRPIVETYVQDMKIHENERLLWRDWYMLGQALPSGPELRVVPMVKDGPWGRPLGFLYGYEAAGFLQEAYIDRTRFDRQHYAFQYVGREFLGSVRCLVFDVEPLLRAKKGFFRGRIWAEDEGYTVVRFSGTYTEMHRFRMGHPVPHLEKQHPLHFDSWRVNVQPNLWLPAYIFTQELNLKYGFKHKYGFKAQTRFWGYNLQNVRRTGEFTNLTIESTTPIPAAGVENQQDRSPVEAQREWRSGAERNALDTLQRTGLLAVPGDVDKTLDTVVNNLVVTNRLDVEPEVRCRVLITGNLDMFSIGHTIIVSRGLLDVLPDEATLAAMLARELAYIVADKGSPDRYGFGDAVQVSASDVVARFANRKSKQDLQEANREGLLLLKNSPYGDKLGNAGMFLKQLRQQLVALPQLVNPNLGNGVYLANEIMSAAPPLEPKRLDQIAALPVGARVKLDPWTDSVEFLKTQPVRLTSVKEKLPFEITPFMPELTRYEEPKRTADTVEGIRTEPVTLSTSEPKAVPRPADLSSSIKIRPPETPNGSLEETPVLGAPVKQVRKHPYMGKKFWIPFASTLALQAVSIELTAHCEHEGCAETDPMLGQNPSRAKMYGIKFGVMALAWWWCYTQEDPKSDNPHWKLFTFVSLPSAAFDAAWDAYQTANPPSRTHSALVANVPASQVQVISKR